MHSADVTGITNITAGNPIVWTFMSTENEANSRIIFTKWLREGLLNSLHYTNTQSRYKLTSRQPSMCAKFSGVQQATDQALQRY